MGSVLWVGESEVWTDVPPCHDTPRLAVPLIEETVLEVAHRHDRGIGVSGLPTNAAFNCASKVRLRQALAKGAPSLNPSWYTEQRDICIHKASASTRGLGVRSLPQNPHERTLMLYEPELWMMGVVEGEIPGPQYEVNGYVTAATVTELGAYEQIWGETVFRHPQLIAYRDAPHKIGLTRATNAAVTALGLRWCCFCFEFRIERGQPILIDAHARLGEDRALIPALGVDVLQRVTRAFEAAL